MDRYAYFICMMNIKDRIEHFLVARQPVFISMGGGGRGGGEGRISLLFENSIVLIKCTLYDTVFQR